MSTMTPEEKARSVEAIAQAIDFEGSKTRFAGKLGITVRSVNNWLRADIVQWPSMYNAERVRRLTGGVICECQIRPDIYGPEKSVPNKCWHGRQRDGDDDVG